MKSYLNHKFSTYLIMALAVSSVLLSACDDDDPSAVPDDGATSTSSGGIVMAFKSTGGNETEFIISQDDIMTGEISAIGTGIEQTGWRFFYPVGKTLFSSGFSVDNQMAGYADNGAGYITQIGEFIFENALEMFGASDDDQTLLDMEIPRSGFTNRRLHFVDANTI